MHIIYVSNTLSKSYFEEWVQQEKLVISRNIQNHHTLLLEGFEHNGVEIDVLSIRPRNFKLGYHKSHQDKVGLRHYHYLPIVNIPLIVHGFDILFSFFKAFQLMNKHPDAFVFSDILVSKNSIATLLVSKLLHRKFIGFITDSPNDMFTSRFSFERWFSNFLIQHSSAYVLMSRQQLDFCNPNKPYIVIESQADIHSFTQTLPEKASPRIVMFAGTLNRENGVDRLLNAFIKINTDAQLHIFGNGYLSDMVQDYSHQHSSIVYHGTLANQEILQWERKATLLVNPRPLHQGIASYSFPSKLMEYMSSGTPALSTPLPAIPEDYLDYLYLTGDEVDDIEKAIASLLSKSDIELQGFGHKTQQWILQNKNNVVQSKHIMDFVQSVL